MCIRDSGEIEKGSGILTIKNLPASVLTGSDVSKALTVTCNIQDVYKRQTWR